MSNLREQVEAELDGLFPIELKSCSAALLVLALADLMDTTPTAATAKELRTQYDALVTAVLDQAPAQDADPLDDLKAAREARRTG